MAQSGNRKEYQHRYYLEHKEEIKKKNAASAKKWRTENKEKSREYFRQYRQKAKEQRMEELNSRVRIDNDFEQVLISAERYACGRMSYIVSTTIDYIRALMPKLSDWCLSIMAKDIEEEAAMCERVGGKVKMGMDRDHQAWLDFQRDILMELEKRKEQKADSE